MSISPREESRPNTFYKWRYMTAYIFQNTCKPLSFIDLWDTWQKTKCSWNDKTIQTKLKYVIFKTEIVSTHSLFWKIVMEIQGVYLLFLAYMIISSNAYLLKCRTFGKMLFDDEKRQADGLVAENGLTKLLSGSGMICCRIK